MDSLRTGRQSFSREWVKTLSSWRLVQAKRSGYTPAALIFKDLRFTLSTQEACHSFFAAVSSSARALFSYPQCNLVIIYGLQPILIQKSQLVVFKIHEQTFVVLSVVPLRIEPLLVGYRMNMR